MLVEEVMTKDLVTCPVDATLQDAVEAMLRNQVGSVIIHDDRVPTGIVTETDTLHAGYVTEEPFTEIPVKKTMSSPLVTITRKKTLRRATQRMKEEDVKKLPVVEDMDLVGIITAQDVIRNYHELKAQITEIVRPHQGRNFEPRSSDTEGDSHQN